MITNIDLDGVRLNTHAATNAKAKRFRIFNADSLNVIIGDNGTGKTRALKNIVAAMRREGQALGCDIHFDDDNNMLAEVAKFGVAYYTSIPYHVELPRNSKRFKNASLAFGEENCFNRVDVQQFTHVAEVLNIRTRPMIEMSSNYALVLPVLARALVRAISQGGDESPSLKHLFNVEDIARQSTALLKALGLPLHNPDPAEIEKRRIGERARWEAKELCDKILHLIKGHDRYKPVVALSAFEAVAKNSNDLTAISIVFFDQVLGIHLGPASRFPKTEATIKARLHSTLQKKTAIYEAEKKWEYVDDGETMSVKAEYEDSGVLKSFKEDELSKFAKIYWGNFSSGQLAIFYQFTALWHAAKGFADAGLSKILLLLDEGDIFLHTSWQRRYIELLNDFVGKLREEFGFEALQIVLTTHSSAVVTDIPGEFIFRLDDRSSGKRNPDPILGFAAAPQDIVNSSFSTSSIGSFAQKLLTKTARNIRRSGGSERDKYIISLIDDPVIKREFLRLSAAYSTSPERDD